MNEAMKKDASLPATPLCTATGCYRTGSQCVDVSESLQLRPVATVGTVTSVCQGSPDVLCETAADGSYCTVTLTQRICLSIPVTFAVGMESGAATIACATDQ